MSNPLPQLSRREREIMDILFAVGEATLTDIEQRMESPPTRPALRSLVTILEGKGHVTHDELKRGREFVYRPAHEVTHVGRSAFGNVLETFFGGSITNALASFLSDPKGRISDADLKELSQFITQHKKNRPS
jgi:predicted transcriptional regulator